MINYIHYKVRNDITQPVPNFDSATIEAWEWISKVFSFPFYTGNHLPGLHKFYEMNHS